MSDRSEPPPPPPPAGWYPHPSTPGWWRWWDGRTWTAHWVPVPQPTAPQSGVVWSAGTGGVSGWTAVGALGILFGAQLLAGLVAGAILVAASGELDRSFLLVASVAAEVIALVGVALLLRRRLGDWARTVGPARPSARQVLVGAGVGLATPFVLGAVAGVLAELLDVRAGEEPTQLLLSELDDMHVAVAVLAALLAVVLAPVVEELVFRRCLYVALRSRVGVAWAVLASAVLFALIHFELLGAGVIGVIQLLLLTGFGVLLAVLYQRTDGLAAPVSAHATFNLVAVASVLLAS